MRNAWFFSSKGIERTIPIRHDLAAILQAASYCKESTPPRPRLSGLPPGLHMPQAYGPLPEQLRTQWAASIARDASIEASLLCVAAVIPPAVLPPVALSCLA